MSNQNSNSSQENLDNDNNIALSQEIYNTLSDLNFDTRTLTLTMAPITETITDLTMAHSKPIIYEIDKNNKTDIENENKNKTEISRISRITPQTVEDRYETEGCKARMFIPQTAEDSYELKLLHSKLNNIELEKEEITHKLTKEIECLKQMNCKILDDLICIRNNDITKTINGKEQNYIDKPNDNKIINEWDTNAIQTLNNWYATFKELSFCYQYILDRNYKISTALSMISVVSSSTLSIFSGFKLWIQNDMTFQSASDIFMMISNFAVAAITTMSKRYIDDARNEKIKSYVSELDGFMGLICAQITLTPEFRMPATKFFETQMKQYTKLMITMPSISIKEMKIAKQNYENYTNYEKTHSIFSNNNYSVIN